MKLRSKTAYVLAGLLAGALLVPTTVAVAKDILDVRVVNTAAQPVPVAAGGEPVVLDLHDFCSEDGDVFTVPAGKKLVIEDVGSSATVPSGERRSAVLLIDDPATTEVAFAWTQPQTLQSQEGSVDIWVSHESLKTYALSGWKVEARIGNCANSNAGGLLMTLSGYLTPAT